jgi:hypothetical protein
MGQPAPSERPFGERLIIQAMGGEVEPPPDADQTIRQLNGIRDWFATRGIDAAHGAGPIPELVWVDTENAAYLSANRLPGGNRELFLVGRDKTTHDAFNKMDVIGHEFTHRITEHHFDLQPTGNRGGFGANAAVREHISDVFAQVISEDRSGLIGEEVRPGGLRSMANPSDPQYGVRGVILPTDARDTVLTAADQGGAHYNTGTLSKVAHEFQLKYGLEELGDTYLDALKQGRITSKSGFNDVARAIWRTAAERHPDGDHADFLRAQYKNLHLDPAPLGQRSAELGAKILRAVHIR